MPETRLIKNGRMAASRVEEEVVLLDAEEGEVIRFNPVAAEIWEAADGQRTAGQIAEHVALCFDIDPKKARKDVSKFLKKLFQQEILFKAGEK